MATLSISSVILHCDGCNKPLNDGETFRSSTEARAAAYAAGWRFPPMATKTGKLSAQGSDACPECLPNWKTLPLASRHSYQRLDGSVR
ncbi:hypothetical protein [Streptomyces fumanus]|uniref:hypothetical protein n=1 Tax=Streptomyces fumanus TaxID=67302 RepID=UPI0034111DC1